MKTKTKKVHTEDCMDTNDDTSALKGKCICLKQGHTPGPWKIDASDKERNIIHAGGSRCIANVDNADEEDRANARLICAAPELYQALKFMNHVDPETGYCICPLNDGAAPFEKHSTMCNDAMLAIAKAEGLI